MPNIYHDILETKINNTFDWITPLLELKYDNQSLKTMEHYRLRRFKWRYAKQKQLYQKYQKLNNSIKKVYTIKKIKKTYI